MKKAILSLAIILCSIAGITAQEKQQQGKKRHFSHEEFQAKQKEYITRKAQLTEAEGKP